MKRLWPVVKLTFRLPFRSGGWLLLPGCAAVAALTFIISRSDGVLANEVAIRSRYALYFSLTVLSMALLWYACVSMRGDIDVKRLHLLTSYPLPRWQIYTGKWLGLLGFACIGLLSCLIAVGLCVAMLTWGWDDVGEKTAFKTRYGRVQRLVQPEPPPIAAEVEKRLTELREAGHVRTAAEAEEARRHLRRQIDLETRRVPRNGSKTWRFAAGPIPRHGDLATLRFHFYARDKQRPVYGRWLVEAPNHPWRYRGESNVLPYHDYELRVPLSAIPPDGEFRVTWTGEGNPEVVFPRGRGLVLLYDSGSWVGNFVRLLPPLIAHLGAVIAVGLTISVAFTMSVASFVALVVYLLAIAGPFFAGMLEELVGGVGEEGHVLNTLGETVIPVGLFFTTGLERPDVVGPASQAMAVGLDNIGMPVTRMVGAALLYPVRLLSGEAFLWLQANGIDLLLGFCCYLAVAAGLGMWLLARKELDRVH